MREVNVFKENHFSLGDVEISLNSLATVVMDDEDTLYLLLVGQDEVCIITNSYYCAWVITLCQVEKSILKIKKKPPSFLK